LEAEYKRVLGIKKIIWLKGGAVNDDKAQKGILPCGVYGGGTGGHIDEICRFVNAHTILLAEQSTGKSECDSLAQINFDRLEENYKILQSATDQDGMPFDIIRIPAAPFLYDTIIVRDQDTSFFAGSHKGQTIKVLIASSFLNFIIANGIVLIPKYYKEGDPLSIKEKDEEVIKIFRNVFAGRKIIQIDVRELNYGGGGMHCATTHQPVVEKRN
jgi:agmatine deiminase